MALEEKKQREIEEKRERAQSARRERAMSQTRLKADLARTRSANIENHHAMMNKNRDKLAKEKEADKQRRLSNYARIK